MASGTFQQNSLDWQAQLFRQRISEWLERLLGNPRGANGSPWEVPEWLREAIFWFVVLAAVGWTGWQLYKLLQPYVVPHLRSKTALDRSSDSISSSQLTIAEWLQRSQNAQRQDNYREACRSLYMATLQRLNDATLILQEPSRTDGEYLALSQSLSPFTAYQTLIQTHERLHFSDVAVSREVYDRCWQAYQEIEGEMRQVSSV